MNKKADIDTIKTLILLLSIAIIIFVLTVVITGSVNTSRKSNLCLLSIDLMVKGKGDLACERNVDFFKKSDLSSPDTVSRRIATDLVSCRNTVGSGTQNPFIDDPYKSKSNCIVCSDLQFEDGTKVNGLPYWSAVNTIPGSSDSFFFRMSGWNPSDELLQQIKGLSGFGVIDVSKEYHVFWKVDKNKEYWDALLKSRDDGNPLKLIGRDGSVKEYKLLGNSVDNLFIIGTDFFGFVINVDEDKDFVSSVWMGSDDILTSSFDLTRKVVTSVKPYVESVENTGGFCYYVHN